MRGIEREGVEEGWGGEIDGRGECMLLADELCL